MPEKGAMNRSHIVLLLSGLTVSASGRAPQAPPTSDSTEQVTAALQAVTAMQQMNAAPNPGGGAAPSSVGSALAGATLGDSMQVLFVRRDELRSFQSGGDPGALLHDTERVMYPVSVGGVVRSSATLENRNGV
jgi:hypothetical protein